MSRRTTLPAVVLLVLAVSLAAPGCKHASSAKTAKTGGTAPSAAPGENASKAEDPGESQPKGGAKEAGNTRTAKAPVAATAKPLPKGVDTKDLDATELKIFVSIVDDQFDPCGKPRNFRQSLDDGDCALSRRLGRFVVHKLQQGYGKRKIVKLLLREIERINTIVEIDLQGAPLMGPAASKVKVVIFSDFECPFCRRTAKPIKQLQTHYGFALYYKHYPLKASHPHAEGAAKAAWAAQQQGKFWEMHDTLFEHAPELKWEQVQTYAKDLGLDLKKFIKDVQSKQAQAAVDRDYAHGGDADVDGTPTFFVNGRRAETLRQLQDAVREQSSLTGRKNMPERIELGEVDDPTEPENPPKKAAENSAAENSAAENSAAENSTGAEGAPVGTNGAAAADVKKVN